MNQTAWKTVEKALPSLTPAQKRKLLQKVTDSLYAKRGPPSVAAQQKAFRELCRQLAALPVHNPNDGFSNRDHDKILYGGSK
jgi:hypothetical protein